MDSLSEFTRVKEATSLKAFADDHLERARRGHAYACPFCGSGGRGTANSDSAFSIRDDVFKCFACGAGGDIFDLAAQVFGIDTDNHAAQLEAVADWARLPLMVSQAREHAEAMSPSPAVEPAPVIKPERDYAAGRAAERDFILQAQGNISDPEAVAYLERRGWTLEDARRFGLGWDKAKRRIVIPYCGSEYYHIDRAIDEAAKPKYLKPKADDVGAEPIWNPAALEMECLIVVEGAFDAMALERMGYEAVALGGVGIRDLLAFIQMRAEPPVCVLCFDRDAAGQKAQAGAVKALSEAHLPYLTVEWPNELKGKDCDEMARGNRAGLEAALRPVWEKAEEWHEKAAEKAFEAAVQTLKVTDPNAAAWGLLSLENCPEPVPTGFKNLDKALGGGLPAAGLVTLGAISSMGKTTLALQIAEQIADGGRAALFVTIEQSAKELVAKSLSRLTATMDGVQYAATANEIASPAARAAWGTRKTEHLAQACEAFCKRSGKLRIVEAVKQPTVSDIEAAARWFARREERPPVVFVDYLQLLKPPNDRDDDKRATDGNIRQLRQLARDLQTPVVVISSLNRASYSTGVTLEAFKESGAIEYGSDVLLGLQPFNMSNQLENIDDKRAKSKGRQIARDCKADDVRKCEISILKNRNGATPKEGVRMMFDAPHGNWYER